MNIGQVRGVVGAETKYVPKHDVQIQQQEVSVPQLNAKTSYEEFAKDLKGDDELLNKSVDQANKALKKVDRYIERRVHEKTGALLYELKDEKTGEVIAEFPSKKIQDMIAKMWELAGLFVDERA